MPGYGRGLKAWSLMAAVAIVAVSLAAARAESAPAAGIAIIGACASYLGYKTYSGGVTKRQASGLTTSRFQKAGLILGSTTFAASVIGISDLAFLSGYYGYLELVEASVIMTHWTPYNDPGHMTTGVVIGVALALCVASSLRRTFGGAEPRYPRRWLNLWPVGVVNFIGAAWGAKELRERYSICQMMASYHAGREARAEGAKKEAVHAWLRRWYERAAIRPWLPVHPDRIPRGLE